MSSAAGKCSSLDSGLLCPSGLSVNEPLTSWDPLCWIFKVVSKEGLLWSTERRRRVHHAVSLGQHVHTCVKYTSSCCPQACRLFSMQWWELCCKVFWYDGQLTALLVWLCLREWGLPTQRDAQRQHADGTSGWSGPAVPLGCAQAALQGPSCRQAQAWGFSSSSWLVVMLSTAYCNAEYPVLQYWVPATAVVGTAAPSTGYCSTEYRIL